MSLEQCRGELCAALRAVVAYNSTTDGLPTAADCDPSACITMFVDSALATAACPDGVLTHMCIDGALICAAPSNIKCGYVAIGEAVQALATQTGVNSVEFAALGVTVAGQVTPASLFTPTGVRSDLNPGDTADTAFTVTATTGGCTSAVTGCATRWAVRLRMRDAQFPGTWNAGVIGDITGPLAASNLTPPAPGIFGVPAGAMDGGTFAGAADGHIYATVDAVLPTAALAIDWTTDAANANPDFVLYDMQMWQYDPVDVTCDGDGNPVSAQDCDGNPVTLADVVYF